MFPERKNPYALLIEQFLTNVQGASQANAQRFQNRREERLIGEERKFRTDERLGTQQFQAQLQDDQQAATADLQRDAQVFQRGERIAGQDFTTARDTRITNEARVDAQIERENQLTDAATNQRNQKVQQLTNALALLDPESEEYKEGVRILQALALDPGLRGQAALDAIVNGVLILDDGESVNINTLLPMYANMAAEREREQGIMDVMAGAGAEYMANPLITAEAKMNYWNILAASGKYTDDVLSSLLAGIGMTDPLKIQQALADKRLTEAQITDIESQTAYRYTQNDALLLDIARAERFEDLEYEQLAVAVENARETLRMNDVEVFMAYGALPSDPARAANLAKRLGYTDVRELQAAGEARFARLQRREGLAEDLDRLAVEAARVGIQGDKAQIDLVRAQEIAQTILNNREMTWGFIRERAELGELAFAAAQNGNVQLLTMLSGLAELDEYSEQLAGIDFDALTELAGKYLTSEEEKLEHDRDVRRLTINSSELAFETDASAFYSTVGATFAREDFTVGEDGRMPVEDAVDAAIQGMTAGAIRALGGEEVVRARLMTEAWRAKDALNRTESGALLDVLSQAVPAPTVDAEGNRVTNAARQNWRTQFLTTAESAGIPREVAEVIAQGLLDGTDAEFYGTWLENEEIKARTRLYLAQAAELEPTEGETPWQMDTELFDDLRAGLEAQLSNHLSMFEKQGCSINTGDIPVTLPDGPSCAQIADDIAAAQNGLNRIMLARVSGDPRHLDDFYSEVAFDDPSFAWRAGLDIIAEMEGADTVGLDSVRQASPENYATIVQAVTDGLISSPEQFNTAVNDALAEAAIMTPAAGSGPLVSLAEFSNRFGDFWNRGSEWREMSAADKASALDSVAEWRSFMSDVIENGMPSTELRNRGPFETSDEREAAVRFGFILPNTWPGRPDIPAFREAVRISTETAEARRAAFESSRAPSGQATPQSTAVSGQGSARVAAPANIASMPTADADRTLRSLGYVTSDGMPSDEVMNALFTQESGGKHIGGAGAVSENDLTQSSQGALGIAQIMPTTAWRPGYNMQPLITMSPEDNATMAALNQEYSAANATRKAEIRSQMTELVRPYMTEVPEAAHREFARTYLSKLLTQFDGSLTMALAAYNAGPGTVQAVARAAPGAWLSNLRTETQRYVPSILRMLASPRTEAAAPRANPNQVAW